MCFPEIESAEESPGTKSGGGLRCALLLEGVAVTHLLFFLHIATAPPDIVEIN